MDEVKDEATWCDVVADDLPNMGTENFCTVTCRRTSSFGSDWSMVENQVQSANGTYLCFRCNRQEMLMINNDLNPENTEMQCTYEPCSQQAFLFEMDLAYKKKPSELSGWLASLRGRDLQPEGFMDLIETLEVDVASTYVATGCGDCVKGVAPVSTWPTISRRVVCTHDGEVWNTVSVSTVPGDNYLLGGSVPYLVLYEFMPDFLDYILTAERDTELTLTKPMKAEINQGLDKLLGDQTVYWNLWAEEETADDIAEIYGSLPNANDSVVEIYSPPRVVEEAKKRGLRAELSIDLCTGYDLKDVKAKEHVRKELAKRRPKLLVSSPPCTKLSPF